MNRVKFFLFGAVVFFTVVLSSCDLMVKETSGGCTVEYTNDLSVDAIVKVYDFGGLDKPTHFFQFVLIPGETRVLAYEWSWKYEVDKNEGELFGSIEAAGLSRVSLQDRVLKNGGSYLVTIFASSGSISYNLEEK